MAGDKAGLADQIRRDHLVLAEAQGELWKICLSDASTTILPAANCKRSTAVGSQVKRLVRLF